MLKACNPYFQRAWLCHFRSLTSLPTCFFQCTFSHPGLLGSPQYGISDQYISDSVRALGMVYYLKSYFFLQRSQFPSWMIILSPSPLLSDLLTYIVDKDQPLLLPFQAKVLSSAILIKIQINSIYC